MTDLNLLLASIKKLPVGEQQEMLKLLDQIDETQKLERARKEFIPYIDHMWPGFIKGAHHKVMAKAFEDIASGTCKRLMINMPPRHALKLGTLIPTTNGWKTIETLRVGDSLFGPDGLPTIVLGKSDVFRNRELFRVSTTDGASLECDGQHLWTFRMQTSVDSKYYTKTTEELLVKDYRHGPYLPRHSLVQYPGRDLLVPPYVLGAWLGDGAASCGTMAAHPDDAGYIRSRFEELGVKTTDTKWKMTFGTNGLMVSLREIGVLNNKHIPENYLTASVHQRIELLRGLMDTDGDVSKCGKCTFNTSNYELADQVLELVRSFGVKARVTRRQTNYKGKPSRPSFRIMFKLAGAASLPRKAERCRDASGNWSRSITISPAGRGDVQCIKVDRPDGLFLAGRGYIVTHNTKSEFSSIFLPSWYMGKFPDCKIIQASCISELAVGFGRKVRNLIRSEQYQKVFPGTQLTADAKAAGYWTTSKGGEYYAIGTGGNVAGRGADLFVIDDPHSEQDAILGVAGDNGVWEKAWDWYQSGPLQRLQPGGAIALIATRWSLLDMTGRALKLAMELGEVDEWRVIQFPAILPSGEPLFPEYWSLDELVKKRDRMTSVMWNAQYQQNPTSEEGALIKREWWKTWEGKTPPFCEIVLQSWDTAHDKTTRADYSACTMWGIFKLKVEDKNGNEREELNIILLDAFRDKMEFPELKKRAKQYYKKHKPDMLTIEKKASGAPLIAELRKVGIPVQDFTPVRGNDKFVRINAVSDMFKSGMVWAPDTKFANDVIDECAAFPNGEHDDYVDTVTQALARFRNGGFVRIPDDDDDWDSELKKRPRADYY